MTFDVLENPATGERAVVRQHASAANGQLTVGDLYASPGAAVVGEHLHPRAVETFTVVRGVVGLTAAGVPDQAAPGDRVSVPAGVPHDWWNAGPDTAFVIVEMGPEPRFEEMIKNLFFLAADGKSDAGAAPGCYGPRCWRASSPTSSASPSLQSGTANALHSGSAAADRVPLHPERDHRAPEAGRSMRDGVCWRTSRDGAVR